jgi:mRNA interferase MazF
VRPLKWNKDKNIRDSGHWLASKIELIELKDEILKNNQKANIKRGGIFNVELGRGNIGAEKNKLRPCLIISRNILNNGQTVVIIPLSTKFDYKLISLKKVPRYKNHFILFADEYSFSRDDLCLKCEDIRVIDKVRIKDHLGNIKKFHLDMVKKRILFTLGF